MASDPEIDLLDLREALEASWDSQTSYLNVSEEGNPALGQCYPTSWVVQSFLLDTEIVEGQVWTGAKAEKHFWNVIKVGEALYPIDFTWQQFPANSKIQSYKIRDRDKLGDGPETVKRCQLLRNRVLQYLEAKSNKPSQQ